MIERSLRLGTLLKNLFIVVDYDLEVVVIVFLGYSAALSETQALLSYTSLCVQHPRFLKLLVDFKFNRC